MAMEKKSLVSKKAATPTKSKSTKSKIDTSKPAASKVVAATQSHGCTSIQGGGVAQLDSAADCGGLQAQGRLVWP